MRFPRLLSLLMVASLLAGCAGRSRTDVPTPIPASYLPTAIALTLEASGVHAIPPLAPASPTPPASVTTPPDSTPSPAAVTPAGLETGAPVSTEPASASTEALATVTVASLDAATNTPPPNPAPPTDQAAFPTLEPLPTYTSSPPSATPQPAVPEANIQIMLMGELSLVTSPFLVWSKISTGGGKTVRIELHGEDGRLLQRLVKEYPKSPWTKAALSMDLVYEINAAAELGRLVISVEDPFGRLIDVNSINLVLLSNGVTELNVPYPWQTIVIQEPARKALIQGGTLLVSGLARPSTDQPLRAALIAEDGRILGQRLAGVTITKPGEHGVFVAEVPFNVDTLTPALLVVYEEGGNISDITHLSSMQVLLAP